MRVVQMNPSSVKRGHATEQKVHHSTQKEPAISLPLNFHNFKKDDWILLGIITALILEGSDDYILLCALGYLFIMGI